MDAAQPSTPVKSVLGARGAVTPSCSVRQDEDVRRKRRSSREVAVGPQASESAPVTTQVR